MKSSKVPIIVNLPEHLKKIRTYCTSDIHNGSADFDEKRWKRFEELLQQPHAYVIFAGDQCEYATKQSKSDIYSQVLSPRQQKDWWIEHLEPYKDKVICMVDGNHEYNRASKEADDFPLYDISLALGIQDRYRSEGAIVDIGVGDGGHGRGKQVRYVGRVQHKAKNNVNFCTAHDYEGIDFFVSGHTHKPMDKAIAKLVYDTKNKTIIHKNVENVVCGSFLNFASYVEREGHGPTSTKQYYLFMSGKKKEVVAQGFYV